MSTPGEKLAASLELLRELQENNTIVAIKASEMTRTHRD